MSLPEEKDKSDEEEGEEKSTEMITPSTGGSRGGGSGSGSGGGTNVSSVSSSISTSSRRHTSSAEASSYQMYDRLVFLAVPLAVVIKDGAEVQTKNESEFDSFSAFEGGVKPQLLVESGLQNMVWCGVVWYGVVALVCVGCVRC